mgnify:CR=1 FL=1|tara:strand:- start:959 stop:1867 length:909 start_codon:yes stop_codon:yes gene_type:complete
MKSVFQVSALCSLILVSTSSWAMTDSELAQSMNQDIAKYMSVIKAPKLLFHWVDASDVNPKGEYNKRYEATAAHYEQYVVKQGRRIYNNRRSGDSDIEGPGLYMASDPLVSRSYGGERSYGLIVGVLRVGAKVLTGSGMNLSIASDLKLEIQKRGCNAYSYETILDTFDKTCAKIKKLLVDKDASFANGRIYSWGSNHVSGCSSRSIDRDVRFPSGMSSYRDPETFVVYNKELFSQVYGFTHKSLGDGDSLSQKILSYLKGLELSSGKEVLPDLQMDNSDISAMSAAKVKSFSQDYILGCVE